MLSYSFLTFLGHDRHRLGFGFGFTIWVGRNETALIAWMEENIGKRGLDWWIVRFTDPAHDILVVPSEDGAALTRIFWC